MNFLFYFLLFFIYSVIGWFVEVTYVYIGTKKFINRGFLIGPYIPIYGYSALIMALYLTQYKDNPLTVFLLAIFICTFIEYMISFNMEKLFNARWWDYSNSKFNINGRVCLKNGLGFGFLSLLLIYLINPWLVNLLGKLNPKLLIIISVICLVIFVFDFITSLIVTFDIKNKIKKFDSDSTTEIRELINDKIKKKLLKRRVLNAFPRVKFLKFKK
ncbi:putative membrane protein [Acholeplasma sp. CAG:878]|nr:putative membrane protein [Acholeplasma sp. CAG:878]